MDTRSEIREFLTSRRAKLKAADVGGPVYSQRRVPGLRREEVTVLAGMSVPDYKRVERGDLFGASNSVLEALAQALQLDETARAHLFDLARAAQPMARPSPLPRDVRRSGAPERSPLRLSRPARPRLLPRLGPRRPRRRRDVAFDDGLTIFTYTAYPGTRSAEALSLLGSLAAAHALPASGPDRR